MFPKRDIIFEALVFGIKISKLDKDIVVEVVNEDGIGRNHQLSDMIVDELLKFGFVGV
jgi:hypothetical protein